VYQKLGGQPDVNKLNIEVIIAKIGQEQNPAADFTHKTVKEKIRFTGSHDDPVEYPRHKTKADYCKHDQCNNRPD
jgi:hypothetical protein